MLEFLADHYIPWVALPGAGALALIVFNVLFETAVVRGNVDTIENYPRFLGPVAWANVASTAAIIVTTAPLVVVDVFFAGVQPFAPTDYPPTLLSLVILPWSAWLISLILATLLERWVLLRSFLGEEHDHGDLTRGVIRAHLFTFGVLVLPVILGTLVYRQLS